MITLLLKYPLRALLVPSVAKVIFETPTGTDGFCPEAKVI
jgi:hypothetical protein